MAKTYPVSISLGGDGCLAILFAPKGKMTKATLTIDPDARTLAIDGQSPSVKNIQRHYSFDQLQEVEAKGPLFLSIRTKDGQTTLLKDVDHVIEILNLLEGHVPDVTKDLVRKRVERFEKRVG
jgi:hypothetical protein